MRKHDIAQFILDVALEDRKKSGDPRWDHWFSSVSRMFGRRMPDMLVTGLANSGVSHLKALCEDERRRLHELALKSMKGPAWEAIKNERWIRRRNEGNERAMTRKQEEERRLLRREKEEVDAEQTRIFWEERLREYKRDRDDAIASCLS